ncbi:hypothetical protein [Ulvibacterium marinum]|uniref:Uncharacterized protein n=1 Tax=Ulvibacterium marinum TaxID=2419782 RepID=A0A3B0C537_9FLAO|nr:hypothetical protein [Ulvibacterium marinum]RKN79861.1 hypothetical protein D7Z94_16455 [Ulvibacterium marinum]
MTLQKAEKEYYPETWNILLKIRFKGISILQQSSFVRSVEQDIGRNSIQKVNLGLTKDSRIAGEVIEPLQANTDGIKCFRLESLESIKNKPYN